jgi:hypothetical protein
MKLSLPSLVFVLDSSHIDLGSKSLLACGAFLSTRLVPSESGTQYEANSRERDVILAKFERKESLTTNDQLVGTMMYYSASQRIPTLRFRLAVSGSQSRL